MSHVTHMNESCHTYDRRADTAGTTRDEDEKSGIVFVWKYVSVSVYIYFALYMYTYMYATTH